MVGVLAMASALTRTMAAIIAVRCHPFLPVRSTRTVIVTVERLAMGTTHWRARSIGWRLEGEVNMHKRRSK